MSESEVGLRLFVVGAPSGDPDDWGDFGNRAIVLAHDEAEALELVDFSSAVAEIKASEPVVLCYDFSRI